jgi:two-component system chemotaxis sensor kinase CheA
VDLARYTALFLAESRDHLQRCNAALLAWERAPGTPFPTDELFRAFHSVKGSAGALGFEPITDLAHAGEQALAAVREGDLVPSRDVVDLFFQGLDGLAESVEAIARGEAPPVPAALRQALLDLVPSRPASPRSERRVRSRPSRVPESPGPATPAPGRQVRVDLERLDLLVNQVNELVVTRNRLAAIADREIGSELEQVSSRIAGLVSRLHSGVIWARMAPVDELFSRFPRLVRDLARELGKEIRLSVMGSEIEVDRAVLDGLSDPLTHLIRNAADHGIESPAERRAAGKPEEGTIRLRAERTAQEVILVVGDDGRGIDRAAIRRRAIELGLSSAGAPLPDAAGLLQLLASPGFTTRDEVTRVSGRGVGIDAVVNRVRELGGRFELKTRPGQGTTFLLRLPASRSLVGVIVVRSGGERYAIPFSMLAEAAMHEGNGPEISLRGEPVPTADLGRLMGHPESSGGRRPAIVVEREGRRAALVVDALLGQQDVVLERFVAPPGLPPWVGGAAILSDGAPALVLDPAALF